MQCVTLVLDSGQLGVVTNLVSLGQLGTWMLCLVILMWLWSRLSSRPSVS